MSIKKYLYVGIGVFLFIVFLAVCVTAEFKLSVITSDVYAFVEDFFNRWSPALAAAGTVIVAILTFIAIYESRRTRMIMMHEQRFFEVEEWTRNNMALIGRIRVMFGLSRYKIEAKRRLERQNRKLKHEEKILENQKHTRNAEVISRLEDITRRLKENREKQIKISKEIMQILQDDSENTKKNIDEIMRTWGQISYSEAIVKPVIRAIGDSELLTLFDAYYCLGLQLTKMISKEDLTKIDSLTSAINKILSGLVERVNYLREKL